MRSGINAVIQVGFTHIHIEGKNKILFQAVLGHIRTPWKIQVLVHDINTYFQFCNNVTIIHICREGNHTYD